jgi:hypothetical protein
MTNATFAKIIRLKAAWAESSSGPTGLCHKVLHIALSDILARLLNFQESGRREAADSPSGI